VARRPKNLTLARDISAFGLGQRTRLTSQAGKIHFQEAYWIITPAGNTSQQSPYRRQRPKKRKAYIPHLAWRKGNAYNCYCIRYNHSPSNARERPRLIERNETVAEPVDDGPGNEPDTVSENDVPVTVHGTKSATKTNVPCVSLETRKDVSRLLGHPIPFVGLSDKMRQSSSPFQVPAATSRSLLIASPPVIPTILDTM
jgi:hypothetical protein